MLPGSIAAPRYLLREGGGQKPHHIVANILYSFHLRYSILRIFKDSLYIYNMQFSVGFKHFTDHYAHQQFPPSTSKFHYAVPVEYYSISATRIAPFSFSPVGE